MLPLSKRRALAALIARFDAMTKADCIDMANYTAIPTSIQVQCLKDHGIRRAIVGASFGGVWPGQITALEAGGIEVEEYQFPTRLHATDRRWWVDCETGDATIKAIREACQAGAYGIYTRRGWWIDETSDWKITSEFPELRLWEAHYGDPPPAFVPFGGWTSRAIIQWHDSTTLCGLNVDLNIIEETEAPPVEEEDDMKPFMVWNEDKKQAVLLTLGGGALIYDAADVPKLEGLYGKMIPMKDIDIQSIAKGVI